MPVTTAGLGRSPTVFQRKLPPADRTRQTHPKRAAAAWQLGSPSIDDNPVPKIL
ncbi:hypothetical protein ABIC65_000559 [Sphingomonas trueperi]|uniref:hypothetical protein n=1 Tax=Sphingomonas trueperi TaxID=53317 RepID=UPI003392DA36